ncbi:MAG: CDP-alcohol phosphatidyltransferase family protein [Deltaproteobacteria bacterium]|nr:CDP-alcohol phosphatidyltransferase family protein [Deltaproteobacteria bacterium]
MEVSSASPKGVEGEAPPALPVEGATRAPVIVIRVDSIEIATRKILGLPVLVRTLKALEKEGVSPIFVITPDPIELKKRLPSVPGLFVTNPPQKGAVHLSGNFHYDPDFISWAVHNHILNPHERLKEVPERWWEDLRDEKSFKRAGKKLFANIKAKTEGWVAPHLNKPVSFFLTRFLVRTSITPNQITLANLFIALAAALLMAGTDYGTRLWGAGLMYFSSIVDGCDGEVARLKMLSSKKGAWFDTIADDLSNNLFYAAIFVGLFRSLGDLFYLQGGLVVIMMSLGVSMVIYDQLLKGSSANAKDFRLGYKTWLEYLRPAMKRDFFIAVIFILMVLDLRTTVFWISGGAIAATFILYVVSFTLSRVKRAASS